MTGDDRFTWGLVFDVFEVLERHGYHRYDNQHTGQAFGMIFDLAYVYDGTRDASYRPYPQAAVPGPQAEPGSSGPDTGVVSRASAETSTVAATRGTAADYEHDRAADRADSVDRSGSTCQSRFRDARAHGQMAARMLDTAGTSAASAQQPEPGRGEPKDSGPNAVSDREAGQ